jgi:hypothetical protein
MDTAPASYAEGLGFKSRPGEPALLSKAFRLQMNLACKNVSNY